MAKQSTVSSSSSDLGHINKDIVSDFLSSGWEEINGDDIYADVESLDSFSITSQSEEDAKSQGSTDNSAGFCAPQPNLDNICLLKYIVDISYDPHRRGFDLTGDLYEKREIIVDDDSDELPRFLRHDLGDSLGSGLTVAVIDPVESESRTLGCHVLGDGECVECDSFGILPTSYQEDLTSYGGTLKGDSSLKLSPRIGGAVDGDSSVKLPSVKLASPPQENSTEFGGAIDGHSFGKLPPPPHQENSTGYGSCDFFKKLPPSPSPHQAGFGGCDSFKRLASSPHQEDSTRFRGTVDGDQIRNIPPPPHQDSFGGTIDNGEGHDDEDEDGDGDSMKMDDELVPWGLTSRLEKQRMKKLGKRSCAKMKNSKKMAHVYIKAACIHGKHGLGLKVY